MQVFSVTGDSFVLLISPAGDEFSPEGPQPAKNTMVRESGTCFPNMLALVTEEVGNSPTEVTDSLKSGTQGTLVL